MLVGSLFSLTADPVAAQVHREFIEVHMGMPVRIVLYAADETTARSAARAAFHRIAGLEDIFSDYRPHSELRRLGSRASSWVRVSEPLFYVLQRARDIARLTGGAFDPTAGPLTALWREARRTGALPTSAALDSARRLTGWQMLQVDAGSRAVRLTSAGMRLDLGGIAKGYILQTALRLLQEHGLDAALIEAGGDIVAGAAPPGRSGWRIDTPGAGSVFAARAASLRRAAIATSGATFQYLEANGTRHSHIIDPRTGRAVTRPVITRVIATDATLADALATALSVDPTAADLLLRHFPDIEIDVTPVGAGVKPLLSAPPSEPRREMRTVGSRSAGKAAS